ncbi:hypothetical protein ACFQ2B_40410 [Streptomyces stramineus]
MQLLPQTVLGLALHHRQAAAPLDLGSRLLPQTPQPTRPRSRGKGPPLGVLTVFHR